MQFNNKLKTFFGEIDLIGAVKTDLSEDEFLSLFDAETGLDTKLVLKTYNNKEVEVDIMDFNVHWTK